MNRGTANQAIEQAASDAIAGMFNVLRTNELAEAREIAIGQFTTGLRNLLRDIETAKTIIEAEFPKPE